MGRLSSMLAAVVLATAASAHFTLDYPPSAGFDEDKEPTGPCGGFPPTGGNATEFHVGGDNVALNLLHPQGVWLFRGTLDTTGNSNWTSLFPEVQQSGLGKFCEPAISVPASWAGQKGVIGVVVDAPDGLLYQCSLVNFINGTASKMQSQCSNSSVQASFFNDKALSTVAGVPTTTATGSGGGSSSTGTHNAAPGPVGESMSFGSLTVALFMAVMGAAYII